MFLGPRAFQCPVAHLFCSPIRPHSHFSINQRCNFLYPSPVSFYSPSSIPSLPNHHPTDTLQNRAAAITAARTRGAAQKLWAGTVKIHPNAKTGAHHHGHLESIIYIVKGRARMRWGDKLEFVAEAGEGDFIFVPPYVPHQEINAKEGEELECVLVRSDGEAVAVNLPDLEPVVSYLSACSVIDDCWEL